MKVNRLPRNERPDLVTMTFILEYNLRPPWTWLLSLFHNDLLEINTNINLIHLIHLFFSSLIATCIRKGCTSLSLHCVYISYFPLIFILFFVFLFSFSAIFVFLFIYSTAQEENRLTLTLRFNSS